MVGTILANIFWLCFHVSGLLLLAVLLLHRTQGTQSAHTEKENTEKHSTFRQKHTGAEGTPNSNFQEERVNEGENFLY